MNPQQSKSKESKLDWGKVDQYIMEQIPNLPNSPLQVKPFSAGYSNLTYFISKGDWQAVLRRPPFGPLPPKAHDMKREFEIQSKLERYLSLVPRPYFYCEDTRIMDRHFYVMEKKEGIVLDDKLPEEFEKRTESGAMVSNAFIDSLVRIHEVDYEAAGLSTFGYPEGYVSRQVNGWIKRFHLSKTNDTPSVDQLENWLINNIPPSPAPTIVHNDFKLNNMMFSASNPGEVVGIFDWELSTIGDPLTDLATAIAYWKEPGEGDTGLTSVTSNDGFFSRRELLESYAKKSGRDVSNIDFHLTFAFYKIAVILQQIYYRWKIGEAEDERFSRLNIGIKNLLELASKAQRKEIFR